MKKTAFFIIFAFIALNAFSQSDELPVFMFEVNSGYAVGVDLENAVQIDAKIISRFRNVGFLLEAGTLRTPDEPSVHIFLGPLVFFINDEKWRIPLALGFDLFHGETLYYGIGGIVSAHRTLSNNIYTGINLGITYAFNNVYNELTGYSKRKELTDDGSGNAVYIERTVPVFEKKDHFGRYIYIRPSIIIGIQL